LLLVEGLIDTLTGWEYGFPTVGLLGEPSPQQIKQINNSGVNIIYLATDNDGPGERFRRLLK
jgi:DNA primase